MRTLLVLVLASGCVGGLRASGVQCLTLTMGSPFPNTTCGQTFVSNELMNWGAPSAAGGLGEANGATANLGQTVDTTASGVSDQITITSNMMLERADNTAYAWNPASGAWNFPTVTTFAGHFNGPSSETSTAPYGPGNYPYQYGDPLLGATTGSSGTTPGNAQMDFNFSQALYGLAFQVTGASGVNSDFSATLYAFDASGNALGFSQITATGLGGVCPGLSNPGNGAGDPVPCNDAPTIQFYDPQGRIASVALTVNDTSGLFISPMALDVTGGFTNQSFLDTDAPEPRSAPLIVVGLIAMALLAKRRLLSPARAER